jgi:hypothetical protein
MAGSRDEMRKPPFFNHFDLPTSHLPISPLSLWFSVSPFAHFSLFSLAAVVDAQSQMPAGSGGRCLKKRLTRVLFFDNQFCRVSEFSGESKGY